MLSKINKKRTPWMIISMLMACYFPTHAQTVNIDEKTILNVQACTFQLAHMHLILNGDFYFDSISSFSFLGKNKEYLFAASKTPNIHLLKIGGDMRLDMDSLYVFGDIIFFEKGILNIEDTKVILQGNILNEDNEKYLTASSLGQVIKTVQIPPNTWLNIMGLRLWLKESTPRITISRSHKSEQRKEQNSLTKQFHFSPPIQIEKMIFPFLDAERNGITEPMLSFQSSTSTQWEFAEVDIHKISQDKNKIQAENFSDIRRLTLFSYPSLSYPAYFSPNEDGIHDTYIIEGSEKHENTRFVVLNAQGKMVFESTPYRNDFSGKGLASGTYFFLFFKSKKDTKPKKGSFELIR